MRAKLRAEVVLQTGITLAEARGRSSWEKLQYRLRNLIEESIENLNGKPLASYLEKDVALTATYKDNSRTWDLVLRGKVDLVILIHFKRTLFTMLFEVTEYKGAPEVVRSRLQAYASALYGDFGFPVVPVLVVMREQDVVEDVLILASKTPVPGVVLRSTIYELIRILSHGEGLKSSISEICAFCDPPIRRLCPYSH